MPTSYQTVPLAVPPKTLAIPPEEPAPTSVPTMKKLVAAAMVGTALVGGYSYGFSTNPAMINNVNNGFATGVSYSGTYCTASDRHESDDATLYSAPGVVLADHESWFFGPLKGDPATVCLEVCLTPSEAVNLQQKVQREWPDNIKVHPAGCLTFGYTAYEYESTYVQLHPKLLVGPETEHKSSSALLFWIPILKKPVWYV